MNTEYTTPDTDLNLDADERHLRASANAIAREAIDGSRRYEWEPIGGEDGSVNEMTGILGGTLILRARTTDDVAIYRLPDGDWRIVADANGPVVIRRA